MLIDFLFGFITDSLELLSTISGVTFYHLNLTLTVVIKHAGLTVFPELFEPLDCREHKSSLLVSKTSVLAKRVEANYKFYFSGNGWLKRDFRPIFFIGVKGLA
jgi:hypothetical protein